MLDPEEQLHIIKSGIAEAVPEDELRDKLAEDRALVVKLGVDPTAPDLHLGHAVPLRKLRQLQDLGHTVVLIIGDFTALIGDPSGRSATRPALSVEEIDANAETYTDQAFRILDRERTTLRRNSEWLGSLDFESILRLTSQFTIARVLERDDFAKRYASRQPISMHEFLYPVMQAYDSVVTEADIEIGGTDQLFNLLAGRELMEKLGMKPQVCLTLPLLEGTDGVQKMSKSYGNYVGLTDDPADMFGKVMSIPDELIVKYFRLCTALSVEEVDRVEGGLFAGTEAPNVVKRRLAREIVGFYHDAYAARGAEAAFDRVFKDRLPPEDIRVHLFTPDSETVYAPALLRDAGTVASGTAARDFIDSGAVKIDGHTVDPGRYEWSWSDFVGKPVQIGKRIWIVFKSAEDIPG